MEELRAAEKARAKKRRTILVLAAVVVVALVAGGILWATTRPSFCGNVASGSPDGKQWKSAPAMSIDTSANNSATLKTSCGDIGIRLDAENAPQTVNSFVYLAKQDYFDHTRCHRLTTSGIYVLQCGDPTGTGSGGPGYTLPDEYLKDPAIQGGSYPAGTVAMANTGAAHTGGSQFFLVYRASQLAASYTPFGTITSGLDILQHIAGNGVQGGGSDGAPKDKVAINSVAVTKD
nr:peptidylprolyl isomerase [Streptacidiphilus carbonis]